MSANVMDVSSENFKEEVSNSKLPVMVDFWAEWCMPCKMISPTVDELSKNNAGKVKFAKVNVDNSPELATNLQILSIPALILFKGGKEIKRIVGVKTKEQIQIEIDSGLKSN
ncbi:MAG: thioredoxin [Candidatus Omnitrophota bacterium]